MGTPTLVVLVAVATLITALLFGTQYSGLVPWLHKRRSRKQSADISATPVTQSAVPDEAPSTATAGTAPTATLPVQSAQPSEPNYLRINRLLIEQGQPRAAKWACYLPQIFVNLGGIVYFTGIFLLFPLSLGALTVAHHGWLASVPTYMFLLSMLFYSLSWTTPSIILQGANIAWLVHRLRTE